MFGSDRDHTISLIVHKPGSRKISPFGDQLQPYGFKDMDGTPVRTGKGY